MLKLICTYGFLLSSTDDIKVESCGIVSSMFYIRCIVSMVDTPWEYVLLCLISRDCFIGQVMAISVMLRMTCVTKLIL